MCNYSNHTACIIQFNVNTFDYQKVDTGSTDMGANICFAL